MKSMVCATLLLFLSFSNGESLGQSNSTCVGLWEDSRTWGSDAHGDVFRFWKDGTFQFTYSQYQWAGRRILSFSGMYQILADSLRLTVHETQELLGGRIEIDGYPGAWQWVVKHADKATVKQQNAQPILLEITFESVESHTYFELEGVKFLKIGENPDQQLE